GHKCACSNDAATVRNSSRTPIAIRSAEIVGAVVLGQATVNYGEVTTVELLKWDSVVIENIAKEFANFTRHVLFDLRGEFWESCASLTEYVIGAHPVSTELSHVLTATSSCQQAVDLTVDLSFC